MTVLALSLDTGDVILNPYPLTGPVGLSLGLMPWLVSGAHAGPAPSPFDYRPFVTQLLDSGATVTALPPSDPGRAGQGRRAAPARLPVAAARRGVVDARARRVRAAAASTAQRRCCSMSIRSAISPAWCCAARRAQASPRCRSATSISRTTRRPSSSRRNSAGSARASRRAAVARTAGAARARRDRCRAMRRASSPPGLRAEAEPSDSGRLRLKRDPELLHHGGFAIAASELDQLYQSFPGYLDAACFVLPDPIIGDRIFAAVVPKAERADLARGAAPLSGRAAGRALQIPRPAAGGEADPARCRRPRAARADLAAGVVSTPPASPRRRS